jgi:hypothetical protein
MAPARIRAAFLADSVHHGVRMTTHAMRETIEPCGLLEPNADVLALAAEHER